MNIFKRNLLFVLLLLLSLTAKAQLTIPMLDVDIILLKESNCSMDFYRQVATNQYKEVYLEEDEDDNGFYFYYQDTSTNRTYSWEQLQEKQAEIIHVTDLNDISETDFLKKIAQYHWVVEDTSLNKQQKHFYMNMGKNLLMRCKIELSVAQRGGGFGVFEQQTNLDSMQWRDRGVDFFQIAFIEFKKGKKLMTLIDERGNIEGIIQVKKDKLIFTCEKYPIKATTIPEAEQLRGEFYRYFRTNNWYVRTQDTLTGKYGLDSWFRQTILPKQYDTLTYSPTFIVAEKNNKVEIYRTSQEKIEIPNVIKAYPARQYLEILTPLGASYYDVNLNPIKKLPNLSYSLCGTVSGTFYEISLHKKSYVSLKVETSNTGDYDKKLYLPLELPYKKVDSLHFLNGRKTMSWTENSSMTRRSYMNPELLRFRRKGKYGILEYDLLLSYYFEYNSSYVMKDTTKTRYREEIIYTPYYPDSIKKVLPAEYNHIEFNDENGLIYLHKRTKIGFYPQQIEPIYTQFEPKTNSFYAITREGKKGWIDIQKWKEYFWD